MALREKIKRVLSRSSTNPRASSPQAPSSVLPPKRQHTDKQDKENKNAAQPNNTTTSGLKSAILKRRSKRSTDNWPKIELYKPHEVPRSKYRGPFNREHLQNLADYSIPKATMNTRPRSMLSDLSPMGTWAPPTRRGSFSHPLAIDAAAAAGNNFGENIENILSSPSTREDDISDIKNSHELQLSHQRPHYHHGHDYDTASSSSLDRYGTSNISASTLLTSHTDEEQQHQSPSSKTTTATVFDKSNHRPSTGGSIKQDGPFEPSELRAALQSVRIQ